MNHHDPIRLVGGDPQVISDQWVADGRHTCGLDYVGLTALLRIRYVGDRMPLMYLGNSIPPSLARWISDVDYKGTTALVLDLSYAYGMTRKGNVVRINHGLPDPIVTVKRDTGLAVETEVAKALRDLGRNPAAFRLSDAISYLH